MGDTEYTNSSNKTFRWISKNVRSYNRGTKVITNAVDTFTIEGSMYDQELGFTINVPNNQTDLYLSIEIRVGVNMLPVDFSDLINYDDNIVKDTFELDLSLFDSSSNDFPIKCVIPKKYFNGPSWEIEVSRRGSSVDPVTIAFIQAPPVPLYTGKPATLSFFSIASEVSGNSEDAPIPTIICDLSTDYHSDNVVPDIATATRDEDNTALLKFGDTFTIPTLQPVKHTGHIWCRKEDMFDLNDAIVNFSYTSKLLGL